LFHRAKRPAIRTIVHDVHIFKVVGQSTSCLFSQEVAAEYNWRLLERSKLPPVRHDEMRVVHMQHNFESVPLCNCSKDSGTRWSVMDIQNVATSCCL
jgi:hypothetical protein